MVEKALVRDPTPKRRFTTRDFYMPPRQLDTIFTTDQHTQYYNDAIRRLKGSGKPDFTQHGLHFYGEGTKGYFWPMLELSVLSPTGVTEFTREPLCGHGLRAATYKSTLDNPNTHKHFIRCAKGKDSEHDCGYWYWVHEVPSAW